MQSNPLKKEYYLKKECRLCGSKKLKKVLDLGPSALCDDYLIKKIKQNKFPLRLFLCKNCSFLQIDAIIVPQAIYRNYIYKTTSSFGLSKHFESYAEAVDKFAGRRNYKFVVDVGSNDGTLLKKFKQKNKRVLGVEPSTKTAQRATREGIPTIGEFFNSDLSDQIVKKYGNADIVTVNNLFANIDNLRDFTRGLIDLLSPEGVLVIESSYAHDMVKNMVFDFIYHEHLSYFSIRPLMRFFQDLGMKLIHLEKSPSKGGSLRYYWAKSSSSLKTDQKTKALIQSEKPLTEKTFKTFHKEIQTQKKNLDNLLNKNKSRVVVGYGASATSTTLISYFGLSRRLDYLVDENDAKIGTFSPGCHLPVYHPGKLRNEKNPVLIILAWRFLKTIYPKIESETATVVVPLPKLAVLRSE